MRITLLLIFLISAIGLQDVDAQEERTLTVEECVRIGTENSRTLAISEAETHRAESKSSEALTYLLPSLSAEASYMRLSDEKPFEIDVPQLPQKIIISPTIRDQRYLALKVQQPIFTGFKLLSAYKAAKDNAAAEIAQFRSDSLDLSLEIQTAYWNLYKAIQLRETVDDNIRLVEAHLSDAQNFLDQGLVTKNEMLEVQAHLSQVRLGKIDAENAVRLSRLNLNKLMGISLDTEISPVSELAGPSGDKTDLEQIASEAMDHRAILDAAEKRKSAARNGITASRSGWLPSVFLAGSYKYARPNSRILPPEDAWEDSWELGIVMSFDIWNWGRTISRTNQAKAQYRQAELAERELRDAIMMQVTAAYLEVDRATQRVEVAADGVAQSEEFYRISRSQFEEDVATGTDLLDAETALLQAQTSYISALADYAIASAGLNRAIGR